MPLLCFQVLRAFAYQLCRSSVLCTTAPSSVIYSWLVRRRRTLRLLRLLPTSLRPWMYLCEVPWLQLGRFRQGVRAAVASHVQSSRSAKSLHSAKALSQAQLWPSMSDLDDVRHHHLQQLREFVPGVTQRRRAVHAFCAMLW